MLSNTRRTISVIILGLLGVGCNEPRGFVARQWALAMRELQIIPVFPPREDVQVGDIYLEPVALEDEKEVMEDDENFLPIGMWIGSMELKAADLKNMYNKRMSFPETVANTTIPTDSTQTENSLSFWHQPSTVHPDGIFAGNDISRLRLVGFPSFMSVTFTRGDLQAAVPAEGLAMLGLAGGASHLKSVTVSVPVAENVAFPINRMLEKAFVNGEPSKGFDKTVIQLPESTTLRQLSGKKENEPIRIRIITEVYYARAIDVSIFTDNTAGFGFTADPVAITNVTAENAVSSSNSSSATSTNTTTSAPNTSGASNTTVTTASNTTSTSATRTPLSRVGQLDTTEPEEGNILPGVNRINSMLSASRMLAPGGEVKIMSVSQTGVSLRRAYQRPMCIGYRCMTFELLPGSVQGSTGSDSVPTSVVRPTEGGFIPSSLRERK